MIKRYIRTHDRQYIVDRPHYWMKGYEFDGELSGDSVIEQIDGQLPRFHAAEFVAEVIEA
jgi:hypothetical protein